MITGHPCDSPVSASVVWVGEWVSGRDGESAAWKEREKDIGSYPFSREGRYEFITLGLLPDLLKYCTYLHFNTCSYKHKLLHKNVSNKWKIECLPSPFPSTPPLSFTRWTMECHMTLAANPLQIMLTASCMCVAFVGRLHFVRPCASLRISAFGCYLTSLPALLPDWMTMFRYLE